MEGNNKIWYAQGLDNSDLKKGARESVKTFDDIAKSAEESGDRIDSAFRKAAKAATALFSIAAAKGFVSNLYKIRSEFQDTEKSMEVFLGSAEKASGFMKQLLDYAWYNMFEFSDLTKESAKLLAFGNDVNDVIPIIDKLSNVASGTKQPLGDLVDLYNKAKNIGKVDAQGLESWAARGVVITDVLKEMGVEVDRSSIKFEHLEMVLNNVTSEGGRFHNLMANQMDNLSASYGQLQDNISVAMNEIGEKTQGAMKGAIDIASELVDNYEDIGRLIAGLVVTYGSYRAALVVATFASKGYTIAAMAQYNWLLIVEKAQKLLNATMLKNPYVLVATAIVGLISVLVALRDRTTDAERAQEEYNKRKEEELRLNDELKSKTDTLISSINSQTASELEKHQAYKQIIELYPELLAKYDEEAIKLMSIIQLNKELSGIRGERATQDNFNNYESTQKRIQELEKSISNLEKVSGPKAAAQLGKFRKELAKEQELLNKYLIDIRRNAFDKWEVSLNDMNKKEIESLLKSRQELADRMKSDGGKTAWVTDITGGRMELTLKEVEDQVSRLSKVYDKRNEATYNYVQLEKKYYNELADAQKKLSDLQKSQDQYTEEDFINKLTEARTEIDNIEKKIKEAFGSKDKKPKKDDLTKDERELAQLRIDLELERRQIELNLMEESSEKELQQIDLDYDKRLIAIEKAEQAELDKIIEYERKKAEAKGLKFNASSISLPEESKTIYSSMRTNAEAERDKNRKKHIEDEIKSDQAAWNELLLKYGDYQEKRLAITQSYEQKIEAARTGGEKALLQKQMEDALDEIDAEHNKRTSTLTLMFSDMSEKSIDELKKIRDEAQGLWEFLSGGEWDAEKGAVFGITKNQFEDIVEDPDKLHKFKKGVDDIKDAIYQLDTPIQQIKEGLKDLFNPDNAGTNKMLSGLDKVQQGYQKYADAVGLAAGALGELGELTGNKGMKKAAGGLNDVMDVAGGAMDGAKVGSAFGPIGAVAGAVVGAAKKVFGILKRNKEERERLQKQIEENQEKEYFGQLEIEEVWRKKYEWSKKIGESTLRHIKREGDELKKQTSANAKAQSELWQKLISTQYKESERFQKTGLFGWGKGKIVEEWRSLAGKSWEQIEALAAQGKLSEEGMKFYEALKKAKEEGSDLEKMQVEYLEKLREVYTGTSYDSLVSGIVDAFKQGKRSASDFAQTFEDLMQGALESSLSLLADESMRKWYEEFAKAGEDGYTQDEIDSLKRDWIKLNENLAKQAEAMEEVTGRRIGQAEQGAASYGAYEKITQDQASSIDGRLTGIFQVSVENGASLKDISRNTLMLGGIGESLSELRNLALDSWSELVSINKNTKLIVQTNEKLDQIIKNTKEL